MNAVRRFIRLNTMVGLLLGVFSLAGCVTLPTLTPAPPESFLDPSISTPVPCSACAEATLAFALTQGKINENNQAASTAEVVRGNAQATLNSANTTLSAAQTQDQNNADIVAAQIAGTAQVVFANAQATLNSAASTQNAALTQDAIRQTQVVDQATTGAQAVLNQQYLNNLAAGTQTAIADTISTQTQAGEATAQWYADQLRQRDEGRQGPIGFLWTWCLPVFLVLLGGLVLWGVWRRLSPPQASRVIVEIPAQRLQAPAPLEFPPHYHHQNEPHPPHLVLDSLDVPTQPTGSDDQAGRWLDEVKRNLTASDRKDEDDNRDN